MDLTWIAAVLSLVTLIIYWMQKRAHSYWERQGVFCPKVPSFITGHMGPFFKFQVTEADALVKYYEEAKMRAKDGIVGLYYFWKPVLLVTDPEAIKAIIINDFEHFIDHPKVTDLEGVDRVAASLFLMRGEKWRSRRAFFNKLFTPSRLKRLYNGVEENCKQILPVLDSKIGEDVELEGLMQKYAINVVTTLLFGLRTDVVENANSIFLKVGRLMMNTPLWSLLKGYFYIVAPSVASALRIRTFHKDIWDFYNRFIKDIVAERKSRPDEYHDDLLNSMLQENTSTDFEGMSIEEIVGHTFMFFVAGYDTATLTMCYCLYELSCRPALQQRLREEVDTMLEKHGNKLSYDAIQEMPLMDNAIAETLRLYPVVGVLRRECNKKYKLRDFTVPEGMSVIFPVHALQRDPQYFTDPEEFNPDRFTDPPPNLNSVYYPFGRGPRICIGKKLAEMEIKIALSWFLREYRLEPSEKLTKPLEFDSMSLFLSNRPAKGLWAKFYRRNRDTETTSERP